MGIIMTLLFSVFFYNGPSPSTVTSRRHVHTALLHHQHLSYCQYTVLPTPRSAQHQDLLERQHFFCISNYLKPALPHYKHQHLPNTNTPQTLLLTHHQHFLNTWTSQVQHFPNTNISLTSTYLQFTHFLCLFLNHSHFNTPV